MVIYATHGVARGMVKDSSRSFVLPTSREEALCATHTPAEMLSSHFVLACRWAAERRRGLAAPMGGDPTLAFASFHHAAQWPRRPRQRSKQDVAASSAADLICRALWRRRCSVGSRTVGLSHRGTTEITLVITCTLRPLCSAAVRWY